MASDPAHHPVEINGKFIGILPDGAIFQKTEGNDKAQTVSVQVAGLCSACVMFDDEIAIEDYEAVAGVSIFYDEGQLKVGVKNGKHVGKIVSVLERFPGHDEGKHYHCIIHLQPGYKNESIRPTIA